AFSAWDQPTPQRVNFQTRTWGNPTTTTASTQGVCLRIKGTPATRIHANINGKTVTVPLDDLLTGSRSGYLGGFLTPAYCFHRAIPRREYTLRADWLHQLSATSKQRDWYYLRVRQYNG